MEGLSDQIFRDFEVILVDHRYEQRRERIAAMARRYIPDIPFYHLPEHRRNGIWYVGASSWNTGIALAEGQVVIMLLDYAYTPPEYVRKHWQHHQDGQKKLIVAPHAYTYLSRDKIAIPPEHIDEAWFRPQEHPELPPHIRFEAENRGQHVWEEDKFLKGGIIDEVSLFTEPFQSSWLSWLIVREPPYNDPKIIMPSGPIGGEFFHAKNESFPLEAILDIGGFPEQCDRGKGPWDTLMGHVFAKAGYQICLDNSNIVYCINPRPIMPSMPWGGFDSSPNGRWTWANGVGYQDTRLAHMAQTGDYHTQNPFDIRKLREKWLNYKRNSLPWPSYDIPDEVYYAT